MSDRILLNRTVYCMDCGKKLGNHAFYINTKRCWSCCKKGKKHPMYGKHHSEETK